MKIREKETHILAEAGIDLALQEQQSKRIRKLKKRTQRCVCTYCGGQLGLRKITYSAYDEAKIEIYCNTCDRIEYGTEPLIYKLAEYYTEVFRFDYYPELDDSANKTRMNIAAINQIMGWAFKNAGLLDEDGFTVPLAADEDTLGEATLLTESELKDQLKE